MSSHYCQDCEIYYDEDACPRCGSAPATSDAGSVDQLDTLVSAASVPNLAALFRRAKETGAIGAVSVYGEGATT